MKNHRIVVARHGGPEVLKVVEEDLPEPKAGEVRVKVQAAGVSAYDLMFRRFSLLPGAPRTPFTLGADVVGTADQIGEGVSTLKPGQAVAGATFCFNGLGGYAEYLCLPASELVPVPAGVDPAEAVCLVTNYLTAYAALHTAAEVRKGERVLIHGAAGGVGTALIELGKQAGLEMYGTASKPNHELVSRLGAVPIDYRAEDFVGRVRALAGGGADAVFDPIGGMRQLLRSHRALRRGGRLVWFGVAATKKGGLWIIPKTMLGIVLLMLFPGGKQVRGFPELGKDNAWYRKTLAELLAMLAAGKLKPVIAGRFPLAEAAQAHELIERGRYAGKAVLMDPRQDHPASRDRRGDDILTGAKPHPPCSILYYSFCSTVLRMIFPFTSAIALVILISRGQAVVHWKIVRQRQMPFPSASAAVCSSAPWSRESNRKRCAATIAAGPM
jgi:NADPH:quinone reductase-like Zn-dependent oxidoreductase